MPGFGYAFPPRPALREIGSSIVGRAVTDTLYVSVNGANTDGHTWRGALNTVSAALDAASADANDCTLILLGPHASYYDIDTADDPPGVGIMSSVIPFLHGPK